MHFRIYFFEEKSSRSESKEIEGEEQEEARRT